MPLALARRAASMALSNDCDEIFQNAHDTSAVLTVSLASSRGSTRPIPVDLQIFDDYWAALRDIDV
jgi:hypothetical protein